MFQYIKVVKVWKTANEFLHFLIFFFENKTAFLHLMIGQKNKKRGSVSGDSLLWKIGGQAYRIPQS